MAKLTLTPNPTFSAKVGISVPGKGKVPTEFTFKHMSRKEVLAWVEASKDKSDVDCVMDIATGWELDDPFTRENVEALCDTYMSAGAEIVSAWMAELRGAQLKN